MSEGVSEREGGNWVCHDMHTHTHTHTHSHTHTLTHSSLGDASPHPMVLRVGGSTADDLSFRAHDPNAAGHVPFAYRDQMLGSEGRGSGSG